MVRDRGPLRDPRVGRLATATLGGGVLAHTFLIGMQTMEAGHAPLHPGAEGIGDRLEFGVARCGRGGGSLGRGIGDLGHGDRG